MLFSNDTERDYLVKRVFPDLHDWCERRRLRLVDVDLRFRLRQGYVGQGGPKPGVSFVPRAKHQFLARNMSFCAYGAR